MKCWYSIKEGKWVEGEINMSAKLLLLSAKKIVAGSLYPYIIMEDPKVTFSADGMNASGLKRDATKEEYVRLNVKIVFSTPKGKISKSVTLDSKAV